MNPFILSISIGPVQDFISAARKTLDLRNGSELLSEIAAAIAKSLQENGCNMVFPAEDGGAAPNKIVCLTDGDPEELALGARQAARDALHARTQQAVEEVEASGAGGCFDLGALRAQCDEFLEFYAAWHPVEPHGYAKARDECERLLAGRKNLRDFTQPSWARGLPKSSLDGGRETVVQASATDDQLGRLSIRSGEQLDGVSVVKRLMGRGEDGVRFPSVVRVACDPLWRSRDQKSLRDFAEKWENEDRELVQRLKGDAEEIYEDYPWDLDPLLLSDGSPTEKETEAHPQLEEMRKGLREITGGRPRGGYYAILAADGDKMGEALSKLEDAESHQGFSRRLASFAGRVREIVPKHRGALVYAGGDDVLAFLPLDRVLDCAQELRDAFSGCMDGLTLSVGVAIVHMHENLRTALEFARRAEKAAKDGGRNALAVARHTRGMGADAPTVVRSWEHNPIKERWRLYADWSEDRVIPSGFAYELRELARELEKLEFDKLEQLVEGEFRRILKRKQVPKSELESVTESLTSDLQELGGTCPANLRTLADTLIIARRLGEASANG